MTKDAIHTSAAPAAIGPYSQAIKSGRTIYLSGQLGLIPETGVLSAGIEAQTAQAFDNISAICRAAGGSMEDIVKVTILLASLADFSTVNAIMEKRFNRPYPARSTYQVAALPKGAAVEIEAILVLP